MSDLDRHLLVLRNLIWMSGVTLEKFSSLGSDEDEQVREEERGIERERGGGGGAHLHVEWPRDVF
jgi:hypothetical protein